MSKTEVHTVRLPVLLIFTNCLAGLTSGPKCQWSGSEDWTVGVCLLPLCECLTTPACVKVVRCHQYAKNVQRQPEHIF